MPKKPIPDQFSDDEMEQMKRYGSAQLGGTGFSDEVEKELDKLQAKREANAAKMRAAQTGGGDVNLAPTEMEQAAVKQRGAVQKQADTQDAQQAAQAQGAQAPVNAPPAPSGPVGTTTTFPAQKGATGGGGNAQQPGQTPPVAPPGGSSPSGPPPEGEEEDDPATQWPPNSD